MFRTLKTFFDEQIARFVEPGDQVDALPLAVAALLLEIANADHETNARERAAIVQAVGQVCGIDEADISALVESAENASAESVSFFDFTNVVNEHFDHARKYELLLMLWRIAFADGRLDHYEEYYIRRLADLLHLSHRDFIRAKLEATPAV